MRRVRYGVGMSLDGFIADGEGGTDWLVADPTYDPGPLLEYAVRKQAARRAPTSARRPARRPQSNPSEPSLRWSATRVGKPRPLRTLSSETGSEVDLIAFESAPPLLRFEIARDGAVLLERTPGLWSDFRARAMIDWWDWAPLARRLASAGLEVVPQRRQPRGRPVATPE